MQLPTREVLLFLKLYEGYTEPIRLGLRWTVFGFYWLRTKDPGPFAGVPLLGALAGEGSKYEKTLFIHAACTMGMLKTVTNVWNMRQYGRESNATLFNQKVYNGNGMLMRRNVWDDRLLKERVANYSAMGHKIYSWDMGVVRSQNPSPKSLT